MILENSGVVNLAVAIMNTRGEDMTVTRIVVGEDWTRIEVSALGCMMIIPDPMAQEVGALHFQHIHPSSHQKSAIPMGSRMYGVVAATSIDLENFELLREHLETGAPHLVKTLRREV
jgi:hypothetical protein